ncbi:hypothetical protein QBC34DRAFT_416682 [Podospora aff. communis PSN243]|uniref:C2H2-type domain-containing protein n=1 Tax=Podospora aff. communis PSN243 TaxID=3040156 RepID=A0AAV9G752_9PEZI|nr:hypothetical protein QBC34DRAFT_416682 [Podospora aff. communis PSN243]
MAAGTTFLGTLPTNPAPSKTPTLPGTRSPRAPRYYFPWAQLRDILLHIVVFSTLHPLAFSAHKIKLSVALLTANGASTLHPETPSRSGKEIPSRPSNDRPQLNKGRRSENVRGTASHNTPRRRKLDSSNGLSPRPDVKRTGVAPAINGRLFACPLYKFNPVEHRECLVKNRLTCISYVVQHLLRFHKAQPIHCPKCGDTFDTRDECNNHIISSAQSCEPRPFHHPGLTEDQLRAIRRRRNGADEETRWFDLWKGMFPETSLPDSPYVLDEQQELLNVIRRAYLIASAWYGERLPNPLALLDWDYVSGLIAMLPFGPARGDRSYLSSDDRALQVPVAGGRSPSDVLSTSQTQPGQSYPPQSITFSDDWAGPSNSSPITGSSQMSSNQEIFTDPFRSTTQSVSGWDSVNFVDECTLPETMPDDDLEMEFDPDSYFSPSTEKDPASGV